MGHPQFQRTPSSSRRQRGLTLIEFMISIVIGMLFVAAVATLIANQSGSRAEVDRSGRMIENGRYAVRSVADDLQMAGYWGEMSGAPSSVALAGVLPDPCSLDLAVLQKATQLHVQAYDAPAAGAAPTCVSQHLPGTDILVVRHADPDTSSLMTAGVADLTKLADGQLYIQTGLNPSGGAFTAVVAFGNSASNATTFTLKKKNKTTLATVRKVAVRIYYVAKCSVESGGSCDAGDGGNPVPTLKMVELGVAAGAPAWLQPVTLSEGIENMQVDFGQDSDGDGTPNGDDVTSVAAVDGWMDVMSVKVHVLARSLEKTPGYVDAKTYELGAGGAVTTGDSGYKRHVFVQSVRLVNPSARRQS